MKAYARLAFGLWVWSVTAALACAQVTLTGTSYVEDFDTLGDGLSTGWSVYTNATANSLGTAATFTNTATTWNSTVSGTAFRNVASDSIIVGASASIQSANTDRALGWRPLSAGTRDGGIVLQLANTLGYENFTLGVDVFTGNNAGASNQTYTLEYRIGSSGGFTSLATYTTASPFSSASLGATSVTLTALENQVEAVYFRFRNAVSGSDSSYDTFAIDSFSLSYSAIPEPATYAMIFGVVTLAGAAIVRRRRMVAGT